MDISVITLAPSENLPKSRSWKDWRAFMKSRGEIKRQKVLTRPLPGDFFLDGLKVVAVMHSPVAQESSEEPVLFVILQ